VANVRFVKTTKEKWLNRDMYDENALYFCQDTNEIFKGSKVYTDGIRVVPTHTDLPECACAADGVVYYITETRNGYTLSPDRTEWLQTIYAPVTDAYQVPESEIYNTVTTVGAVRDIESAIYAYIDKEISNIEISGEQGKDGKTPYIQEGYWYIDGVNTGVKAEGVDGKDGLNGTNGKNGESTYEIWLNAGHSGSEDEFLQWLKGDNDPFGNVVTSIDCYGIPAGTSLNGKTVKDVLTMLLGIKEAPKSAVEFIMDNSIPAYNGTANSQVEEVEYMLLDADTASYTDQGFYKATDEEGNITSAGYQLTIVGNGEADAQTISIPANAVIKMAYRYDLGGTNTWLPYTFDTMDEANYWLLGESFTATVDGDEVVYQTYAYNIDVVGGGDAITSTEYWRFEIEVTN
jgi:hypothetical protein